MRKNFKKLTSFIRVDDPWSCEEKKTFLPCAEEYLPVALWHDTSSGGVIQISQHSSE
jgi:hypothetical protein